MHNRTPRTNRFLLAALVTGFIAVAAPAWAGQVINEDIKLLASDAVVYENVGVSIAIDNGVVAVGAHIHDHNGTDSGSAYLFDASTGVQIAELLPSDAEADDRFGVSIAMDNGIVAVGAWLDDDNGVDSGSAYLFDASTGAQIAKLLPLDGTAGDEFGVSIAIDNGVVAVGAWEDDGNNANSGSAYLFDASTGVQIAKLLASDGTSGDRFGSSIAIDNGVVAVGAYHDDDINNGFESGSAYVFDIGSIGACCAGGECWTVSERQCREFGCPRDPEWVCDADVDGDGQVNPVDSGVVQSNFGNTSDQALCNYDMDCDGQINPVDAGIVQSLFGTCEEPRDACP